MDTLTHIVLGATVGEVLIGKQLGKRALLLGAIAQNLPDIDFLAAFWLSATDNLLAHRGFTHSILFAALLTPLLAVLAKRWHRQQSVSISRWSLFFGIQLAIHLFIDACNAYGVGWFEPFSHQRISFNILFVADPLYSISLGIAFVALVILKTNDTRRIRWALFGLIVSTAYFIHAFINKITIEREVNKILTEQYSSQKKYFTTPTVFNNWLWYVVLESDSGYNIGYKSIFEKESGISFIHHNRNDHLLNTVDDRKSVDQLVRFSQGFYTVSLQKDTLLFNDLRFGQMAGWYDPHSPFVFHYYLQYPDANKLVLQRGRFSGWNKEIGQSLMEHIKGKKNKTPDDF